MNIFSKIIFLSVICQLALQACGGGSAQIAPTLVKGTLYPAVLANESTLANTVEVTLTAAISTVDYGTGQNTKVWAYNGIVPGPTIEAKVGDKVIVHVINKLPEDTTVHFHGVEVPANMDGSNISQAPIKSGETFTYTFKVNRAATYWYHPHVRSNVQVELGLHGAFVVRDPEEDRRLKLPTKEHLLLLDDVKLDENGQVAKEFSDIPAERAVEMLNGREGDILLVNGKINPRIRLQRGVPNRFRIINVSNSRFMRVSVLNHNLWRIGGDAGLISNRIKKRHITEIFNPAYPDNINAAEYYSDPNPELGILLTPGERAEFVFTPKSKFDVISLDWHDIHRGKHAVKVKPVTAAAGTEIRPKHGTPTPPPEEIPPGTPSPAGFDILHANDGGLHNRPLATFELYGNSNHIYVPPSELRPSTALSELEATGKPIEIIYGHTMPDKNGDVVFYIKASMKANPAYDPNSPISVTNMKTILNRSYPFSSVTNAIADKVIANETKIIEITNTTGGDHNFHLHGFMFQLLDTQLIYDDAPEKNITIPAAFTEDKDTIIVARRPGVIGISRSITRLIVKFNDAGREGEIYADGKVPNNSVSGGWVMHCHFLEHADRGMMSFIQVIP